MSFDRASFRRLTGVIAFILATMFSFQITWPGARGDVPARSQEADRVALEAAAALYEGIQTETLPNGLRVFLKPVAGSPVVTTIMAYKVGSADEDLTATGLSHYLEHLMFKGTNKIMPGDIDRMTLRNGGENNANTSEDMTVYYFNFAADRWQEALKIEADRMRNLQIDAKHEFQQEKGAVIAELERDEDEPWDLEQKAILPLLFGPTNPYGHPVIGERDHVKGATAAVIKAHYDKWYHPNNAVLVVAGGIDPDKTLALIRELFGSIPKTELPPRKPLTPSNRQGPMNKEISSKFEVARMMMGFNTIRTGEAGYYALEVLQNLLAGGKTGTLYKGLVEGAEIASAVDASNATGRYPGWFSIQVELLQGKDRAQAEKLVLAELQRLRDKPVSDAELKRAKQGILASIIFQRESIHRLADSIARGVTTNDLDFLKNYLPRIAAVTAQEVQDAARKFLDPEQRVVVWSVPQEKPAKAGAQTLRPTSDAGRRLARKDAGNDSRAGDYSLKNAHKVTLDNGLTLLLLENHRLPIFVASSYVRTVRLSERDDQAGLATLTGQLLDEGTAKHSGPEIAELIENVGGALNFTASTGSVKVLSPDRRLGLGLLLECLIEANFPKAAFDRIQQRQLSLIADAEQQPDSKAQRVFEEMVYGKHPLGRPALGRKETVEALTPADCMAFHRQVLVPNNTLLALVGDFNSQQLIDEIKQLTAGWKSAPVPLPKLPAVAKPEKLTQKIISMPDAAQLHFYLGHPGIRRDNPDFYKLLVMDYVLGTGPGFTDRLSYRMRDREGLAYTVSGNITRTAAEEPGVFTCYIGTFPMNFDRVKSIFLEELNRIRDVAPKPEEVEDAKSYLLGNLPFHWITSNQVAGQLLAIERFHLGFDYLDHYRKAVAAVTPEEVQQVAQKHIDPQRLIMVAAGPVNEKGQPLNKARPAGPKK
jgi:zinc protease